MTHGLVIGKFYPPHRGHKFLIESALRQVDQLSLIICQKRDERPEGQLRASWLQETHPDVNVLLVDDEDYDPNDSALWAQLTRQWLGFVPDLVFTSEDYGDRFARLLGSKHISIDPARTRVPISGSQVRTNPMPNWEFLEPCVRGHYAKRVCIIGAESTGKTTLAQALATHYETNWVSEYGREVSERMLVEHGAYHWQTRDFVAIATTQSAREDQAAREANRLLVCDTDSFATTIWHLRYMGYPSAEVNQIASAHRPPDLYLVSDYRVPFVQDGTRDGEPIREWMHEAFVSALTVQQRPFVILSGSYDERFIQAVDAIDRLLK
jgi:HTH-type transcriptional regulator, transcriptional repressor of NAD biosynthesis genes